MDGHEGDVVDYDVVGDVVVGDACAVDVDFAADRAVVYRGVANAGWGCGVAGQGDVVLLAADQDIACEMRVADAGGAKAVCDEQPLPVVGGDALGGERVDLVLRDRLVRLALVHNRIPQIDAFGWGDKFRNPSLMSGSAGSKPCVVAVWVPFLPLSVRLSRQYRRCSG